MFDTILDKSIAAIIAVIITAVTSNIDRLLKYYKRRSNWFRPEFDLKAGESFNVVTSSKDEADNERLSKSASARYIKEDKTIIGDFEPVLLVLRGRNLEVQHYLSDSLKSRRNEIKHVISFGGGVGNDFTSLVLMKLNCPLQFKEYSIVDLKDATRYVAKWDRYGRIVLDYSLIVRTPNPLCMPELDKTVYIFAGIHKPGTFGAACFTQDKYAGMINEVVSGMKAFAVLAELQVDYIGKKSFDPIITPKSVVRVYDLPYQHL